MTNRQFLFSLALIVIVLGLSACNQSETPVVAAVAETQLEEPAPEAEGPQAADAGAQETPQLVPTFTSTVPPRTATPTKGPPTPTATLVLTATPTPVIHVVEQFDTLLQLSVDYDVPYSALLAVNYLNEDDFLQLGQEIIIPTDDEPETAASELVQSDAEPRAGTEADAEPQTSEAAPVAEETTVDSAPAAAPAPPAPAPPAPAPVASGPTPPDISRADNINPLTGLPVSDPAVLRRRPLLVRIGNDTAARAAQVGLNQADMVYEEITEWWVTRFTAVYLSNTPTTISPVRSARLINVQLGSQFQAAVAHSGGSDGVRWEISQAPLANLDEFYNMAPYFYRPNEGWQTRLAIDAVAARNYLVANGLEAAVTQVGFPFSDTPDGGEPGADIFIPYPSATSFTEWHYDPGSGKYLRWISGAPLVDAGDGQQVATANVIVYFAEHQSTDIVEDSNGATSIRIIVNGTGPAWMFRDGRLIRGTWHSDGTRTPFFRKNDGSPYALKPGNTWVEVVPTFYTIGLNSPEEARSR